MREKVYNVSRYNKYSMLETFNWGDYEELNWAILSNHAGDHIEWISDNSKFMRHYLNCLFATVRYLSFKWIYVVNQENFGQQICGWLLKKLNKISLAFT